MINFDYDYDSDFLHIELGDSPAISSREIAANITKRIDARGLTVGYEIRQAAPVLSRLCDCLGITDDLEAFAA